MENTGRNAYDAAFKLKAKTKVTLRATTKERLRKCATSVVLVRRRKMKMKINYFSGRDFF